HDHLASLSAAVSANGRLFYIIDEGPIASVEAPSRWMLVARDAFNGIMLWKREVAPWEDQLRPFRSGPTELPRRLVALGHYVYVTLGYGRPVTALDAATGETVRTYAGTENTQEILLHDNKLFLVVSEAPAEDGTSANLIRRLTPWSGRKVYGRYVVRYPARSIRVMDADSGELLWQKKDADTELLLPTTLAVSDGHVFFQNQEELIALEAESGDVAWRTERPVSLHRPAFSSPTLVVHDGVVLSADRSHQAQSKTGGTDKTTMEWLVGPVMTSTDGQIMAFSADTGKRLWSAPCHEAFNSPVDVFVARGKVWTGVTRSSRQPGITDVYDLHTGEVTETRSRDQEHITVGFVHGRCYRNKATTNYVLHGRAGVEFVDMSTNRVTADHWIRGTCQYGILPCNGLLYAPPHSCPCYNEAKLNSFNALAAKMDEERWAANAAQRRLEKGPAYKQLVNRKSKIENRPGWPTYRGDGARSGVARASLSLPLRRAWEKSLPGPLTSVVVADGRLLVAQKDAHTLHALDAKEGLALWRFTTGGRIDSPPTVYAGRVYFGSADGWVYCLRAENGELAWRFRVAPDTRLVISFDQLESAWPVHGSVLVHEGRRGVVYAAAGRSSYLDGGMSLIALDALTGERLAERRISHRDPKTGREPQKTITGKRGTYMPGALPDILTSDGDSVFMRHSRFDLNCNPLPPKPDHLFSPAGFLDDSWWHRTYWLVGSVMLPDYHGWPVMGCERITGRLLVSTGDCVYGFGRESYVKAGSHLGLNTSYRLFAADAELGPPKPPAKDPGAWWTSFPGSRVRSIWSKNIPFYARAMALAGDTLFIAGPSDVLDFDSSNPKGEVWLWAVSAKDGTKKDEHRLSATPVFDSMAVCDEGVYLTTVDGKVVCFSEGI
ncbi:MAG: outer membrane protein assembly factor BamB family protein, partial [Planctomycetota bacterium]